jgi:hypothetical protein
VEGCEKLGGIVKQILIPSSVGRLTRRPRTRLTKGGWGFRSETSCGSVTWTQVNRAPRRRDAEGQSGRARSERRPWVEGTRNRFRGAWKENPEEAKPRRGAERMEP